MSNKYAEIAKRRLEEEIEILKNLGEEKDSIAINVNGVNIRFDPQELQVLKQNEIELVDTFEERIIEIKETIENKEEEMKFFKELELDADTIVVYDKIKNKKTYSLINKKDKIISLEKELNTLRIEMLEIERYLKTGEF